jgi:hypothetical protein
MRSPLLSTSDASLKLGEEPVFESVPGLAFLHRLVLALHVVFVEVGACGIRLVCLVLEMTGLNRFVGASFRTQQVNRHVEEAIVAYRRKETVRLAQEMPLWHPSRYRQRLSVHRGEPWDRPVGIGGPTP